MKPILTLISIAVIAFFVAVTVTLGLEGVLILIVGMIAIGGFAALVLYIANN